MKKNTYNIKNTKDILDGVLDIEGFYPLRKYRCSIARVFESILPKILCERIRFAFYKNKVLKIQVSDASIQQDLNFKKKDLLKIFSKIKSFENIKEIMIFRDDRLNSFKPDFSKDFYDANHLKTKNYITSTFKEKSYGIFTNNIKDEKLAKIFENIRTEIKNNLKREEENE